MSNNKEKRERLKIRAKEAGISLKAFRARKYPSVAWGYMVEIIRKRCKKRGQLCTITPDTLRQLYAQQEGKCPITGWDLEPKKSGSGLTPRTMTVDQIISGAGYTPDNVRLVSFQANNSKYTWSDDELIEFCEAVINARKVA